LVPTFENNSGSVFFSSKNVPKVDFFQDNKNDDEQLWKEKQVMKMSS